MYAELVHAKKHYGPATMQICPSHSLGGGNPEPVTAAYLSPIQA